MNNMIVWHHLKTWPEPFQAIEAGIKSFEIRWNDRDFRANDIVVLEYWDPIKMHYTGKKLIRKITYMIQGQWGLPSGLCVLQLGETDESKNARRKPKSRSRNTLQ